MTIAGVYGFNRAAVAQEGLPCSHQAAGEGGVDLLARGLEHPERHPARARGLAAATFVGVEREPAVTREVVERLGLEVELGPGRRPRGRRIAAMAEGGLVRWVRGQGHDLR
eukprot:CAMPEP_0183349358 /NCGR_PEP_ID=MMETSP0164_2-20130417/13568_1 /TAXON_ID=221442 /ORGANISM="Coccolithus pelagicus ssp braarudi, Strain PLY182g" /LENGTH=110 /DNA_ID=CAMNT_0025521067 /DNA_START=437 /DNA_END=764 /DNA_ORIENTATION=-